MLGTYPGVALGVPAEAFLGVAAAFSTLTGVAFAALALAEGTRVRVGRADIVKVEEDVEVRRDEEVRNKCENEEVERKEIELWKSGAISAPLYIDSMGPRTPRSPNTRSGGPPPHAGMRVGRGLKLPDEAGVYRHK